MLVPECGFNKFCCFAVYILIAFWANPEAVIAQPLLSGSRNAVFSSASVSFPQGAWHDVNPASTATIFLDLLIGVFLAVGSCEEIDQKSPERDGKKGDIFDQPPHQN